MRARRSAAAPPRLAFAAVLALAAAAPHTALPGWADNGAAKREAERIFDQRMNAAAKSQQLLVEKRTLAAERLRRHLRAAYKFTRAGATPFWIENAAGLSRQFTIAASRRLLARDLLELELLRREEALAAAARSRAGNNRREIVDVTPPPAGSLTRPVPGGVAAGFGPYLHRPTGARLVRRGIELMTRAGAPVLAVADGTVMYAGPVRRGRDMVLIHHGDYVSLSGRLAGVSVQPEQAIARGEPIGRARGDKLYLEIRLATGGGGFPVDPEPLLSAP